MAATGSTTAAIAPPRPSSGSGASPDTSPSEHLRRPNVGRRRCRAPLDLPPHAGREGIAMNGVSGPRYNGRFIALVGCLFAATCLLFAGVCPRDASGQSSPVMRVGGVTTLNGQPAPVGTTITAMIGTVVCGTASVREGGAYEMTVASAATVPGCGTDDATVTFTVGGTRATHTISW